MNEEKVSALLDKLCGCMWWCPHCREFQRVLEDKCLECGKHCLDEMPILLGDVLEKLKVNVHFPANEFKIGWDNLIALWSYCGISKSFQEICRNIMFDLSDDDRTRMTRQLGKTRLTNNKIKQDLFARALAGSLLTIFK